MAATGTGCNATVDSIMSIGATYSVTVCYSTIMSLPPYAVVTDVPRPPLLWSGYKRLEAPPPPQHPLLYVVVTNLSQPPPTDGDVIG